MATKKSTGHIDTDAQTAPVIADEEVKADLAEAEGKTDEAEQVKAATKLVMKMRSDLIADVDNDLSRIGGERLQKYIHLSNVLGMLDEKLNHI